MVCFSPTGYTLFGMDRTKKQDEDTHNTNGLSGLPGPRAEWRWEESLQLWRRAR